MTQLLCLPTLLCCAAEEAERPSDVTHPVDEGQQPSQQWPSETEPESEQLQSQEPTGAVFAAAITEAQQAASNAWLRVSQASAQHANNNSYGAATLNDSGVLSSKLS